MTPEKMIFCQSCGMPMTVPEHFGTEADGSPSSEYCIYCYKGGVFAQECSMEEIIRHCAQFHKEFRGEDGRTYTREEAVAGMWEFFPHLKRWKR